MRILSIFLFLALGISITWSQDPTKVSGDVYKIVLDNDEVRVLEMKLKAGAEDKLHSHPTETVYFIKGGKAKITLPDGKSMEKEVPDGAAMHHGPWTHQVKNIGKTDIHAIIVEQKTKVNKKAAPPTTK